MMMIKILLGLYGISVIVCCIIGIIGTDIEKKNIVASDRLNMYAILMFSIMVPVINILCFTTYLITAIKLYNRERNSNT